MNLYFRLIWQMLFARFRPVCPVLGPCRTPYQVYPNDLDILRHVNNGRYFTLLDLARTDLMIRSGLADKVKQAGWFPVVAMETIHFRKALTVWQRFEVQTDVLGWDEKAVFLQHRIERKGEIIAVAVVAARFLRRTGGSVLTSDLMALGGITHPSPPLPDWIVAWVQGQNQTQNQTQ
ncbi:MULTISPECIES: acyl-CoA thioesterase [Silvimonas]|uniref:acyl-CoA thioesterase n=1 Tax=Silvimonas TaxID=300264 RepID=UPI0024B335DF|nr:MULTISPECIES: acyl-CoA thioesterase [Silvimonas]MDR3428854.1 acyl-CoA thioesterase [Silvimonas sp.]